MGFREEFLARKGCVAASAPVGVTANVAVGMPDVVAVLFVEFVVGNEAETAAPEGEAFRQAETKPFEEERVLETSEVFEVLVLPESSVEV